MKELNIACFLAAARALNISVAAYELSLSQQAVSRNIRNLEEELGFMLLHRRNDGIRLTEAGIRFQTAFRDFDSRLRSLSTEFSRDTSPRLHLGWSEWSDCPESLLQSIRAFQQAHPSIRVDFSVLSDQELLDRLRDGRLDIVFMTGYALAYAGEPLRLVPGPALPMYLVTAGGQSAAPHTLSHGSVHLASRCHESTDEEVIRRVRREYERLHAAPPSVTVLPNLSTVYAQLMCRGGVTFSPRNLLSGNPARFHLTPLDWRVTLYAAAMPAACELAGVFLAHLAGEEGRL